MPETPSSTAREPAREPTTDLVPLPGYIIVRPLPAPEVSAGGLHIPQQAQVRPNRGTIIAMTEAPGNPANAMLGVGVMVLYNNFVGLEIGEGPDSLLLLEFGDVLAVVRPPAASTPAQP